MLSTSSPDITIQCLPFDSLTPHQLYTIIQLRNAVFVVEQNCVFQDADGKDPYCHHLMIWQEKELAAYARLVPPGIAYEYMSIGRVISSVKMRRKGAGKLLMQEAIQQCRSLFGAGPIQIGAQLYLKDFYGSFGFRAMGEVYLEDNIEHIHMILL
ncbi:MAG: GNAT family N-acetyltransferase [Sediminibacterium sp.]|nr:GNAT family N-acetyltransferase [Sediminibacterium sp.]